MKNDWETHWLPPMTLGIIRMTFLWLDQKPFDIIAGSARNGLGAFGESSTSTKGGRREIKTVLVLCKSISVSPVAAT